MYLKDYRGLDLEEFITYMAKIKSALNNFKSSRAKGLEPNGFLAENFKCDSNVH